MRKPIALVVTALAGAMIIASPAVLSERSVLAGSGGIEVNETNFPDEKFRLCITETTDEGADGILTDEEIQNMTWFSCSNMGIKSLQGIEYLTELTYLDCSYNELTSLNVTSNTRLEELYCGNNSLTKLYVRNNTSLQMLDCGFNKLTKLDLSKNPDLESLYASENQITSIDLSRNSKLTYLDLQDNAGLGTLNVTGNPKLEIMNCINCGLSSIDISRNPLLKMLNCSQNKLTKIDLSHNPDLKDISVNENDLTGVDISKCPQLRYFECYQNNIGYLVINKCPKLVDAFTNGTRSERSDGSVMYYTGDLESGTVMSVLKVDPSTEILLQEPTPTPTTKPTATPTPKPATTTPTKKPATATPTPNPSSGGSSSSSSEGGVEGFVERLYSVALDRASDPNGKADWVSQIKTGKITGADAARGFFLSPEFINSGLSDDEYLNRLYHTFFDREPDQGGFNNWKAQLASGASRESVLNGFINSTEWANLCLKFGIASGGTGVPNITIEPSEEVIGFATRLYTTCLCREPDAGGLNDWASQLANMKISGSVAAQGFFFSQEFINGNYSDSEYVTRLYHTFMNREPDQAGFADWTGQLAAGASRESVFRGFAGSQEWAGICADYGILK